MHQSNPRKPSTDIRHIFRTDCARRSLVNGALIYAWPTAPVLGISTIGLVRVAALEDRQKVLPAAIGLRLETNRAERWPLCSSLALGAS